MNTRKNEVTIYTNGICNRKTKNGGYGIITLNSASRKELFGGFRYTSNNRMELLAAIVGLEAMKGTSTVSIYSDSKALVDAVNKRWVFNWEKKNWSNSGKGEIQNHDLWKRFLKVFRKHNVTLNLISGKKRSTESKRCAQLAKIGTETGIDKRDIFYEMEFNYENRFAKYNDRPEGDCRKAFPRTRRY